MPRKIEEPKKIKTNYGSDRETERWCEEWDTVRQQVLRLTKGKTIYLISEGFRRKYGKRKKEENKA